MVLILITLADGEIIYTESIRINKQGDIVTDDGNIFDLTNIRETKIMWVDAVTLSLYRIKKV